MNAVGNGVKWNRVVVCLFPTARYKTLSPLICEETRWEFNSCIVTHACECRAPRDHQTRTAGAARLGTGSHENYGTNTMQQLLMTNVSRRIVVYGEAHLVHISRESYCYMLIVTICCKWILRARSKDSGPD